MFLAGGCSSVARHGTGEARADPPRADGGRGGKQRGEVVTTRGGLVAVNSGVVFNLQEPPFTL